MIRPVLYVNLPGIVRAFERRARARQGDFAHFVVAPELDEPRSGLAALLSAILPITPNALTWIIEDHWRLLGLAQARIRPGAQAWDLTYLAALTASDAPSDPTTPAHRAAPGANHRGNATVSQYVAPTPRPDDILMGLLQYALNQAIGHGAQRFFARVGADAPELELFVKQGFQRYAIETTYALESAELGLAALDNYDARPQQTTDGPGQSPRAANHATMTPSVGRPTTPRDDRDPIGLRAGWERIPHAYRVEDALHQHRLALAATPALATPGERASGPAMASVLQRSWRSEAAPNQTALIPALRMSSGEHDADDAIETSARPVAPATVGEGLGMTDAPGMIRPETPLRPWRRHDAWGLLRLYDACTPRLVQVAESLTSEEFIFTRAAGGRTWYMPLLEPPTAAFVYDRGDRLGGWLRIRHGRGAEPHLLALLAHPDDAGVAIALVRFALRIFAREAPRPIICMTRGYESEAADALRLAGFTPQDEHALLVRHLTARVAWSREVPAFDSRMVYGVKGFGTAPTRLSGLSKGGKERLCLTSSTTISTPCSPCYPCASKRPSLPSRTGATSSKSSSTLGASPKADSPRAKSF